MPHKFTTLLAVEEIQNDYRNWLVTDDLIWEGTKKPYPDVFIVEAGSITDFASSPWWTWMLLPRIGKYTKAAVLHDKMCEANRLFYLFGGEKPAFSPNDADAVFRKNARDLGTDVVRSELLWVGVRWGALGSRYRWAGWWKTMPRLFADTFLILATVFAGLAGISWVWPW